MSEKTTSDSAPHIHHDELLTEELLDFLALTSHQLRSPLSVIKGYVAMLLDGTFGKVTKKQKVILEKTYMASERMIRLVNNFLDLPRMHVGLLPIHSESISLLQILTHVIAEARLQADIKKIPITWNATPQMSCTIDGDAENLIQAFANILDNAIKYTAVGSIDVFLTRRENACRVAIRDSGPGIAKQDLSSLFNKFMRGDDMRTLYREGRGLGLYISKKIIEGHGGTIWAESAGIGKGSTFYIELPVSDPGKHQ